eukprot:gene3739-4261_t
MDKKQFKYNKFLEPLMSRGSDIDSELSDFEDVITPRPQGSYLSDNESREGRNRHEEMMNNNKDREQAKNYQTNVNNGGRSENKSLFEDLEEFFENRVRTSVARKEACEDIGYAVTYKVLRKVQTVDDRFRANSLVPHGIPYDGLRNGEPILLEMILNLPLGLQNTLYVKKDDAEVGPFVRVQPMSTELWSDCVTNNGFISASKVQLLLRKYVKQAVHVLRKYMSQGRKEKYPQHLKSLFIDSALGITLVINRDVKVRVLPAFPIPDSRKDVLGMDCPSSSHVVCCPKITIQHDLLSMATESTLLPLNANEKRISTAWRISFYFAEKNKLRTIGQGCRMKILRILTEIRDNESELKSLSSYHLKTILFKMSSEISDDAVWSNENIVNRFFDFLNELKSCLIARCLPHFFLREPEFAAVNLLEGMEDKTLDDMVKLLENIIQDPTGYLSAERRKEREELWPWEDDFIPISND